MVVVVSDRVRALAWRGPVDPKAVVDALGRSSTQEIAMRLAGTYAGALLAIVGEAPPDPEARSRAIDLALLDLRFDIGRRLSVLRGLSSLGSATGLLIAIGWALWGRYGDHGLLGLAAGRPERLAMGEGMRAIGIGLATALFGLGSLAGLRREARDRWAEVQEIARHLGA